jgi:hypothetical protein
MVRVDCIERLKHDHRDTKGAHMLDHRFVRSCSSVGALGVGGQGSAVTLPLFRDALLSCLCHGGIVGPLTLLISM